MSNIYLKDDDLLRHNIAIVKRKMINVAASVSKTHHWEPKIMKEELICPLMEENKDLPLKCTSGWHDISPASINCGLHAPAE